MSNTFVSYKKDIQFLPKYKGFTKNWYQVSIFARFRPFKVKFRLFNAEYKPNNRKFGLYASYKPVIQLTYSQLWPPLSL